MRTMLRGFVGTVAGFMTVLGLGAPAHALVITDATLSGGNVSVSGNKAEESADILWLGESGPVTTSNKGGAFSFSTAIVPADCIARLSDGSSSATAAISGCTPDGGTSSLPATGQTGCWNSAGTAIACAGTRQDGDIQAGAALSYTSNADGTITDNNTGLVWEKKTNCTGATHCVADSVTRQGALSYVAGLNTLPCFADKCDWRLPNVKELQSIVNYQNWEPAVSAEFNDCDHGSCTAGWYWSSTSFAGGASDAWIVDFGDGNVLRDQDFGKAGTFRVRAVRGGS